MLVCPNCQFENGDNAKFCKSCGYKLENLNVNPAAAVNAALICPNCGAGLKPGAKFCSKCGGAVTASPVPAYIPEPEPKTEILFPTPEAAVQTSILMPDSAPAPQPAMEPVRSACPNCGALLKPNTKFCSKCGMMISSSAAEPSSPVLPPVPDPVPVPQPAPAPQPDPAPVPQPDPKPASDPASKKPATKNKKPLVTIIIILVLLLLLGGGFYTLSKNGVLFNLPWFNKTEESKETGDPEKSKETEDTEKETGKEPSEKTDSTKTADIASDLEKELAPIAEQVSAGEDKIKNEDYVGASSDLENALHSYAALAAEYDSQDAADTISPAASAAFDLYAQSILKQVETLENQPPTAPLHKQIEITYEAASELSGELKDAALTVSTDALDESFAAFPGRYKEKYIKAFNDLVAEEQWSRTTAWMYMQDAASVGLVDKNNQDDPLTLRYAYALAWSTQKEVSEGRADESLTDEEAIDSILVVIENADYNPVLMRELALCYDALGDSNRYKTVQNACVDVRNYLANNEDIYINPADLLVPGKSFKASSTIDLKDYWYFNDFGDYSPSGTNGLSPEGRAYVRDVCKQAIDSL